MALTINTNISSIVAQRNLNNATTSLNNAIERMTTGYKINHAGDNAAGYSIARNWETQLGSLDVAADNAAMGADMMSTLEDNVSLINSHLQRVRDLTEQAANGTYGKDSKIAIESEIKARLDEINRIAANCEYNGKKLMDGSITANLNLQVGLYSNSGTDTSNTIVLDSSLFTNDTVGGLLVAYKTTAAPGGVTLTNILKAANNGSAAPTMTIDGLATEASKHVIACACSGLVYNAGNFAEQATANCGPEQMLDFIDKVMSDLSTKATTLGAAQNRIDSAVESIGVQTENVTSSLSTLRDADISKESSHYIQAQILQQAAATLLSTANQTPSIALNLI